jgi:hypothetical protein
MQFMKSSAGAFDPSQVTLIASKLIENEESICTNAKAG